MNLGSPGSPAFVGLVSDDLTGATDSAVQFAAAGWDARLVRHLEALDGEAPPSALPPRDRSRLDAVTTNSRPKSHGEAAGTTSAAVDALTRAGIDQLFVKIDSTVRGSVAGQVQGALAAWRKWHPDAIAVICPAFPDHGRTVSAGTVLVHGRPVSQTAAAEDPVTPVTTSSTDQLFPGSSSVGPDEIDGARGGTYVVDAVTNDDLALIAAAIERIGPKAIAVGSAGLAQALSTRWSTRQAVRAPSSRGPARKVLLAVSSLHPAAQSQLARLLDQLPETTIAGRGSTDQSPVVVITTPQRRLTANQSGDVAVSLARRVADELRLRPYEAIVLIGGDGALAVLDELGAAQLDIIANLAPGTPIGSVHGGVAHGLQVVTRSGGFGDADSLLQIVRRLRTPSAVGGPSAPHLQPTPSTSPTKELT